MKEDLKDIEQLLARAAAEIRDLRRRNEILDAKVSTMELFACVLHTEPARQSVGMSEDIAWALDRKANQLRMEITTNG